MLSRFQAALLYALKHAPKEVDMIEVRSTGEDDPLEFDVVVREGQGETRHHVTILSRFDVTVISLYFPEFERELPRYLAQS